MRYRQGLRATRIGHLLKGMVARKEALAPAVIFGLLAFGLYLFLAIADEVAEGELREFDERLLLLFRDSANPSVLRGPAWLQETMVEFTALGGYPVIILTLIAVVGLLVVTRRYGPALFTFVSVWFGWLISDLLKRFYDRPRPDLVDHLDTVHTASFPSGHAMMSTVIYLTLAALVIRFFQDFRVRVYVVVVAVMISVLVGVSRVFLGVHWPSDVVAGWALGIAWACFLWLVVAFLQRSGRRQNADDPDQ